MYEFTLRNEYTNLPRNEKCNKLEAQVGLLFFISFQKAKLFKEEHSLNINTYG